MSSPATRLAEPSADLTGIISHALGEKYHNIRYLTSGGTAAIYLAEWGLSTWQELQTRVLKVDVEPTSPRAILHTARGCDANREAQTMAKVSHLSRHLLTIHDIVDLQPQGYEGNVIVEEYFESQTLEELVKKEKKLDRRAFQDIFTQAIEGLQTLHNAGYLHRDLGPANLLIGKEGTQRLVKIADVRNAARMSELELKARPTAGAHLITDPSLFSSLTGEETAYTSTHERYALGMNMLYALTGKFHLEYTDEPTHAVRRDTGASILDEHGRISKLRQAQALEDALATVDKEAQAYVPIIRKLVTPHLDLRFGSLEEVAEAFAAIGREQEARQTQATEKKKGSMLRKLGAGAAALAFVAAGAIGVAKYASHTPTKAVASAADKSHLVHTEWNSDTLSLGNDYAVLQIENVFDFTTLKNLASAGALYVKPGDVLNVNIGSHKMPGRKEDYVAGKLKGKVYIAGFGNGAEFEIKPKPYNMADMPLDMMFSRELENASAKVTVQQDMQPGCYLLVAELYAPSVFREDQKGTLVFENPGAAINRVTRPIVIGDVHDPLTLRTLKLAYVMNMTIIPTKHEPGESIEMDPSLQYEVSIPERGYRTVGVNEHRNDSWFSFQLPGDRKKDVEKNNKTATMQIVLRRGGKPIFATWMPVREISYTSDRSAWDYEPPTPEFAEQIIKYRKALK